MNRADAGAAGPETAPAAATIPRRRTPPGRTHARGPCILPLHAWPAAPTGTREEQR